MLALITVVLSQLVTAPAGDGTSWESTSVKLAGSPQRVRVATLDDDAWPDVAVMQGALAAYQPHTLMILRNHGDATLRPHWQAALQAGHGENGIPLAVGDVDADGHADLVLANQLTLGTAALRLGDGSGTFPLESPLPDYNGWMEDVQVTDLDGDGHLDVLSSTYDGGQWMYLDRFLGHGDGTFELGGSTWIGFVYEWTHVHVGAGDITAVADLDGVAVGSGALSVSQTGHFGGPMLLGAFARVAVGDLDGDGVDDIAATRPDAHVVSVFLSSGRLLQAETAAYPTRRQPTALVAADLDLDGDLDLAVCNTRSSSVSLFRNLGNGTFQVAGVIPTGPAPVDLAVGDLDLDGDPDLVTANRDGASLSVLRNPLH